MRITDFASFTPCLTSFSLSLPLLEATLAVDKSGISRARPSIFGINGMTTTTTTTLRDARNLFIVAQPPDFLPLSLPASFLTQMFVPDAIEPRSISFWQKTISHNPLAILRQRRAIYRARFSRVRTHSRDSPVIRRAIFFFFFSSFLVRQLFSFAKLKSFPTRKRFAMTGKNTLPLSLVERSYFDTIFSFKLENTSSTGDKLKRLCAQNV